MTAMNGRAARKRKLTTRRGAELDFTELGFGAAPLGNLYRPMTEREARLCLKPCGRTAFDISILRPFMASAFLRRGSTGSCARSREPRISSPPKSDGYSNFANRRSVHGRAFSSKRRPGASVSTIPMTG